MCMAIPSRVVAIDGSIATVEAFGQTRQTSLLMLEQPVAVGDYLVLGAGGHFAADKVDAETAREAIAFMAQAMTDGQA